MTRAALLENSAVVFKDAHPHPRVVSPSDRAGFSKKPSIQMITLIARFRLWQ
jgi:hypothetical protein